MERGLEDGEHSSNEKTVTKPGFFSRSNLLGPVKKDHGDLVLLSYSLCTGMVDAASFSNWGVFVAMQTGMLILLLCCIPLSFTVKQSQTLFLSPSSPLKDHSSLCFGVIAFSFHVYCLASFQHLAASPPRSVHFAHLSRSLD